MFIHPFRWFVGTFLCVAVTFTAQGQSLVFERLHQFPDAPERPEAPVVVGPNGQFYGTTARGGAGNVGVLFRINEAGSFSVLTDFIGGSVVTGSPPRGRMAIDDDGVLYGTTDSTIFRFRVGGDITVLALTNSNSIQPSGLLRGNDGNFYGISNAQGTVFRCTPDGTITTVGRLNGLNGLGTQPYGELAQDAEGNLYGVTQFRPGSLVDSGTIFKVTPGGTTTTLANLPSVPAGGVTFGPDGNLYGMLTNSRVFRATMAGVVTEIATMPSGQGVRPVGSLLLHSDGFLYGTTALGGATNAGVIFKVGTDGTITTFDLSDTGHREPAAGLTVGPDGKLYGTTRSGGPAGLGSVFRYEPGVGISTVAAVERTDGSYPRPTLAHSSNGFIYGTTRSSINGGTIFELTPNGTQHVAQFGGDLGNTPGDGLVKDDTDDIFYGHTALGGVGNRGVIFAWSPGASPSVLASSEFSPILGGLTIANRETLAGVTSTTFPHVFSFVLPGSPNAGFHDLGGIFPSTSSIPRAGLTRGLDLNLYGTISDGGTYGRGRIYRANLSGEITELASFGETDGRIPATALLAAKDGFLYGTTSAGGQGDRPTIFRVSTTGDLATLATLGPSQGTPNSALVEGKDQQLYGTTLGGGAANLGTVYSVSRSGEIKIIHDFAGYAVHERPMGPLHLAADGHLYGTASNSLYRILFPSPPVVGVPAISDISTRSARIAFAVNPNGSEAIGYLEILGRNQFPAQPNPVNGRSPVNVEAVAAGLAPHTRYNFKVRAVNAEGVSDEQAGSFTTLNTPPIAADDFIICNTVETHFEPRTNDFDPDGDLYSSIVSVTQGAAGAVTFEPYEMVYTPGPNYIGSDSFTYTISDGFGGTATATVHVRSSEPLVTAVEDGAVPAGLGSLYGHFSFPTFGVFSGSIKSTSSSRPVRALFHADGSVLLKVGASLPGIDGLVAKVAEPSGQAVLVTLKHGGGTTAMNDTVLLVGLDQPNLRVAVRKGADVPGVSGTTFANFVSIDGEGGTVFFIASLAGRGVNARNDSALCAVLTDGSVRVLAREGDMADGRSIRIIRTLTGVKGTPAEGRWRAGDDGIGVFITFNDGSKAIYSIPADAKNPAGWTRWAGTSDALPAIGPAATIGEIGVPAFAADGVAAVLTAKPGFSGGRERDDSVLVRFVASERMVLAGKGWNVPPTSPSDSPLQFAKLATPVAGLGERTAFTATVVGSGVTQANKTVLCYAVSGDLRTIVRTGVGGLSGYILSSIDSLVLPEDPTRGPIFTATLALDEANEITTKNYRTLWAIDSMGAAQLCLRTGQTVIAKGAYRVVKSFTALVTAPGSSGAARGYNNNGNLTALIVCTDGTEGFAHIQVP